MVRRILSRSLLVFVLGNRFYRWCHQDCQNLGDDRFRAYDSWQWCDPVDE